MTETLALALLRRHDLFARMKTRLMRRGFSEQDAEEDAASWALTNARFDLLESN